jgi:hypothetical protein
VGWCSTDVIENNYVKPKWVQILIRSLKNYNITINDNLFISLIVKYHADHWILLPEYNLGSSFVTSGGGWLIKGWFRLLLF